MNSRVKFKIGQIEFEAEGDAELIARERNEFVSTLLPLAIEAMVRTSSISQGDGLVRNTNFEKLPDANPLKDLDTPLASTDFSKIGLAEFYNAERCNYSQRFYTLCCLF